PRRRGGPVHRAGTPVAHRGRRARRPRHVDRERAGHGGGLRGLGDRRPLPSRNRRGVEMLDGCTTWPAELAARYVREGLWRGEDLGGLPRTWARRDGDRTALVHGDVRLSYR